MTCGQPPLLHNGHHFILPPLVASINPALSAETEATEIWYGTTDGVMGVVDMQQSSASSQVIP